MTTSTPDIRAFTLTAPSAGISVDVTLRTTGGRWVAVAMTGERRDIGIGSKPGVALTAALAWLPAATRVELLADATLLGPSRAVLELVGA